MQPMIEITVKNHVETQMDVPVYMEHPEGKAPKRFLILDRTDGGRENRIDTAVFVVQSYAESKFEAAKLNEQAKKAMDQLVHLPRIAACDLTNDYPFPDTKRKMYRYQAVYNITHY